MIASGAAQPPIFQAAVCIPGLRARALLLDPLAASDVFGLRVRALALVPLLAPDGAVGAGGEVAYSDLSSLNSDFSSSDSDSGHGFCPVACCSDAMILLSLASMRFSRAAALSSALCARRF